MAQAKALRAQAEKGGLRFDAYLPPVLASWLLGLIEEGEFHDPSEAAFVIFGAHRDLEPHADLRHELLNRILQAAVDDPRPGIPAEEVFKKLKEDVPCRNLPYGKNDSPNKSALKEEGYGEGSKTSSIGKSTA